MSRYVKDTRPPGPFVVFVHYAGRCEMYDFKNHFAAFRKAKRVLRETNAWKVTVLRTRDNRRLRTWEYRTRDNRRLRTWEYRTRVKGKR